MHNATKEKRNRQTVLPKLACSITPDPGPLRRWGSLSCVARPRLHRHGSRLRKHCSSIRVQTVVRGLLQVHRQPVAGFFLLRWRAGRMANDHDVCVCLQHARLTTLDTQRWSVRVLAVPGDTLAALLPRAGSARGTLWATVRKPILGSVRRHCKVEGGVATARLKTSCEGKEARRRT